VKDLERGTTSRLTSLPIQNGSPVWAPDGRSIVFGAYNAEAPGIYWIRADGAGSPQRLTDDKTKRTPKSFSPDGKWLAYEQRSADGRIEIWTAPVEGNSGQGAPRVRLGKAEPFLRTAFSESDPAFSPDGRWLAYQSNETGTYEVYVRPFPGPGSKSQISTGGGRFPIWSRGALGAERDLFFLGLDGHVRVASYTAKDNLFVAGKPRVWSPKALLALFGVRPYDLAPDGKRLAVVLYPDGTAEQKPTTSVTVLLNFFDELRRRVPAGGE
jgi:serine/threonine-protein kinase